MIIDPIPLSGPSTHHLEIEYAAEAAGVGWNSRGAMFLRLFRQAVARRARQRFALAVSSSHAALLTALLSLELPPGSEVLTPEIADISLPAAIRHAGLTPVFCDVDPRTLCLSPASAAARITSRTRVMIPVHLYGQMCDMGPLLHLAQQNKIRVIEHATLGLGASYRDHPAGEFGLFSVIGFEADCPVTAGGGAVLLTSNEPLMTKAEKLALRLASPHNPMVFESLNFDCSMSNMEAAIGYGQMLRLDALLERKQTIFSWYAKRLADTPGIRLNPDMPGCVNSRLLVTLFLTDPALKRGPLMEALLASGVVCAPVFYPLSYMPMFTRQNNPAAYNAGSRALLLPCGHDRTEEEVEYVCDVLKQLLADPDLKAANVAPTGWLLQKSHVLERIEEAKEHGMDTPFSFQDRTFVLRVLTRELSRDPGVRALFKELRWKNPHAMLAWLPETGEDMRGMLDNYARKDRDFLLFLVQEGDTIWGHIGLDNFDFKTNSANVDALMIRDDAPRGLGVPTTLALHAWARDQLGLDKLYAHIVGSNKRSRLLAAAVNFRDVNQLSLQRQKRGEGWIFRPLYIIGKDRPDETYVLSVKDLRPEASGGDADAGSSGKAPK